ncbi:MAG: hypothetical protein CMN30_27975 [Sandaracinus sp.]|nr:hypothetical protein [Sandaracinus sp.]
MSVDVLQALLVAWTAVTVFSVALAAFLYVRQRAREYLAFGILGAGSASQTMAAALFYGADDAAGGGFWMNMGFAFGAIAAVGIFFFAHELVGRPSERLVRFMATGAGVGVPLTLAGAFVDPGACVSSQRTLIDLGVFPVAGVTWAYYAYTAFGIGTVVYVMRDVARSRAESREVLLLAIGIYGAAWAVDSTLRALRIEAPFFTEHAVFLSTILASYLLLDRFVRNATALEQRTEELAQSYEELAHVEEELVRKEQLAAVGELSAVIAHEVRNPLAVLRNAVSGLRRQELGQEDRLTLLEVLDEESNRLNRLVRDLLVYARPVEPQAVALELVDVLERAMDLARRDHRRSSQVRVDIAPRTEATTVEGDPDLLERAFANVIENALQAMPDGGALTIQLEPAELADGRPAVAIRFEDTGEGMDTLVRSRARDPFFTTRPSGTGLGLAIVERAVRAHAGEVDLESGDEDGTTVTIALPTRPRAEP